VWHAKALFGFGDPLISDNNIIFEGFFSPTFLGGIFTPTSFVAGAGDTIDGKTLTGIDSFPSISDNGNIVFPGFFSGNIGIFTHTQGHPQSQLDALQDIIDGLESIITELENILESGEISVCHNGVNEKTISVAALGTHLAHGDTLGECP